MSAHDLAESETIIVGDFNEPAVGVITQALEMCGFQQKMDDTTHDHGSTIDHIYYNQQHIDTISEVLNTYYSDHDLTVLMLEKSTQ